jgi:DNA adenine methylase
MHKQQPYNQHGISLTSHPSVVVPIPGVERPKPFLKWAGGKGQLLDGYESLFPKQIDRYFEPFLGGGAVFFHLSATRLPFQAFLSDVNSELINCYTQIRDNLEKVLDLLRFHKEKHSKEYYYEQRSKWGQSSLDVAERASILIYLNKTCFNGLFRVNKSGQFNVPLGRYDNPGIYQPHNLLLTSRALQAADLSVQSFRGIESQLRRGDFVYFDPPYYPLSGTSYFTSYAKNGFSANDQVDLRDFCKELDVSGVPWMLSNSDCEFIRELYSSFNITTIKANRFINSNALKRGTVTEVLIRNY